MAASGGGRSLEQTPTWAVAVVCFVLVLISIIIEHIIHLIGQWLKKKHKRALYESLEKIKSELMLLGFISLLLTVGQGVISNICISKKVGSSWHPCSEEQEEKNAEEKEDSESNRRKLLSVVGVGARRVLASATSADECTAKGKVPFISTDGIHQLHIFIFVLALFHVLYCFLTMAFGRAKMKRWKKWEEETRTIEYQFSHDPERFRFARETSFGRRHLSFWTKNPVLLWMACFFRQFVRSVPKVDYLTLRHGFIMAHLAPQSHTKFDFQKYINRSLEEDFKVVVGISPPIWFFAVLFLLFNTNGWYSYLWLPFIPLVIILLVGTKLQVIITKMGLRIQERGEVVKGVPVVQPGDDLFWFNRPRLILYLINFVLFQNAFQLAFFAWAWYEFGFISCFHENIEDIIIRITMGVVIQILCSYVTLPLYALVTQILIAVSSKVTVEDDGKNGYTTMANEGTSSLEIIFHSFNMGSTMKPTIFNERVAAALRNWHHTAKKNLKHNKSSVTPMSSRPTTPSHHMSPVHLLHRYHSEVDNFYATPRKSNVEGDHWETDSHSPSPPQFHQGDSSSSHHHCVEQKNIELSQPSSAQVAPAPQPIRTQHEIDIGLKEFSFDKRMAP